MENFKMSIKNSISDIFAIANEIVKHKVPFDDISIDELTFTDITTRQVPHTISDNSLKSILNKTLVEKFDLNGIHVVNVGFSNDKNCLPGNRQICRPVRDNNGNVVGIKCKCIPN